MPAGHCAQRHNQGGSIVSSAHPDLARIGRLWLRPYSSCGNQTHGRFPKFTIPRRLLAGHKVKCVDSTATCGSVLAIGSLAGFLLESWTEAFAIPVPEHVSHRNSKRSLAHLQQFLAFPTASTGSILASLRAMISAGRGGKKKAGLASSLLSHPTNVRWPDARKGV
jgi:hypothetical protein